MKFRDEDNLKPLVLSSLSAGGLEDLIEKVSEEYDFVDLQYSTTTYAHGDVEYSALALVREKK